MDWDTTSAAAELIGAIAVIVSILYLAKQVRQSASEFRANIVHSLHSNEVHLQSLPASDGVLAAAVEKAYTGAQLTEVERAQFSMWFYSSMINFEQVFLEYKRLDVESEFFDAQIVRIAGGLEPSIAKAVWRRLRNRFSSQFQEYVEANCMEFSGAD